MNKHKKRSEAEKNIEILLRKARKYSKENPSLAKEYARKARKQAMHFNIKLPRETRKRFCRKCFACLTGSNRTIRLKKSFLVIKCLDCGTLSKYKLN